MALPADTQNSWLARHYLDYVYIPAALLVLGTLIVKRDWAVYSALVALGLGAYNIWSFRESRSGPLHQRRGSWLMNGRAEIKKVLKPDVFQQFELQEKTVISHNVAM